MEQFALKPTIYFGEHSLAALESLAGKRVMVITDDFLSKSGLVARVTEQLRGCTVETFTEVKPDPSIALVAAGAKALAEFRPQAVVAFGGGSSMDCAKAMLEFGKKLGAGEDILFYAVPTTAGTGSEVTSFAVLTDTERGLKYPLVDNALLPDAAILDASLLAGVPPSVTADTGMDVLTHALEAYVSSKATAFTDALAEKAFATAWRNLQQAHRDKGESGAKEQMLLASCLAGIAFNAASLGINHSLAHALGGRYHIPHGRLNAMLMPYVIRFNAEDRGAAEKYARLAGLCGLSGNARALASALARLRESLGMPGALTSCGVERATVQADAEELAAAALADVCTPTNPRRVTEGDLAAILKELV